MVGMLASASILHADDRAPKGPSEDGTLPALVKIAGEGEMNSHAFEFLTELSDDVGARVTGTPAERKAEDWGVAKMQAIGLTNVHKEKYTIWKGWTRGTADAELLTPVRHKLHVDSMGWTGSTPAGGVEGDVVAVNLFDIDNEIKNVSRLKGKVALVVAKGNARRMGIEAFIRMGDLIRAAGPAGAIAIIGGQGGGKAAGMNLTHTGILGFDADFAVPVVSMTAEDQGQLERYLDRGITPHVRFNIQNTFTNGPVETANVVGEIRGTEHPGADPGGRRASGFLGFGGRNHGQRLGHGYGAGSGGRDHAFGREAAAHDSICVVHRRRARAGWIERVCETTSIGNGESSWGI